MTFVRHSTGSRRLRSSLAIAIMFAAMSMALATSASAGTFASQTTLTATDEVGQSDLGSAVALSPDGNTALIGGPGDNGGIGAVWVFVRSGSTWSEQAKLTVKGEVGTGKFGTSVALSSDGKTALIGGPADSGGLGAAWVFTRSGSNWRQRGAKLTGKDAGGAHEEAHCDPLRQSEFNPGGEPYCFVGRPARFGESVALSSDGDTALIGGPGDNEGDGAAWVFTRSGSRWRQQGEKLTGGGEVNEFTHAYGAQHEGGRFGESVALSSDGDTALIGGPYDKTEYYEGGYDQSGGAVWTFTRFGSTWTQQGGKLAGEQFSVGLGAATALSPDGNAALIGSSTDQAYNGSEAAVFTRSRSTWSQQSKLGEPFYLGGFLVGRRVAMSSDGSTALVNEVANGDAFGILSESVPAAEVFRRSGKTWIEEVPPTLEAQPSTCGFRHGYYFEVRETDCGVALSADASTALVGTTAFTVAPVPVVTGVSPPEGREVGGTSVNITGSGFTNVTAVKFGSHSATSFTINSDGSITAVSPPDSGGVDLTATNPYGPSLPWPGDRFRYLPPSPPTVEPASASAITLDSAVLHATVTPNGASVEACRFEYGTEAQRFFGEAFSSVPCEVPGSGETPVEVSASVTGLSPFVRYVWRVVVTNRSGTSSEWGPSFVTSF